MVNAADHLDLESLAELKDVMEEDFGLLIETFIEDSAMRIASLHSALSGDDAEALRQAAHSFKGSCANIGATQLAGHCKVMEDLGHEGVTTGAANILAEAESEYAIVKQLMEQDLRH